MLENAWRSPARLSVAGPAGWAPIEQVVVQHRDAVARVGVARWPVPDELGLDDVVAGHQEPSPEPEAWTPGPWRTTSVLGLRDGRTRTTRWVDGEGRRMETTHSYARHRGSVVCLTQVLPVGDPSLSDAAASIVSSVALGAPADLDEAALPLRPAAVGDLGAVARAWRVGHAATSSQTHVLTAEECFAAAAHHGVAMLPGADTSAWDLLDEAQRELARGVAWRSLQARGAETDAGLREVLEIAASHDLLVVVTALRPGSTTTTWYAARPDRLVRVEPGTSPGTVRASAHDSLALADLVLAESAGATRVTASCVYRQDGRVVGDETAWTASTTPDEVRAALTELLPAEPAQRHLSASAETPLVGQSDTLTTESR